METKIAKTFLKVAEIGNITKAAEQLGYSQSAVTVQIRQLEKDLGVQLFDRVGRGIQLTDAGRDFREYAVRLIRASDDADAFGVDTSEPEGHLVIDTHSTVSIGVLPYLIPKFRKKYPKIRLTIRLSEDEDILIDRVRQNRIDFAILFSPRHDYDGCIRVAEREERFGFIASASDPLVQRKDVPLEELFDDSYISGFISSDKGDAYRDVIGQHISRKEAGSSPSVEYGTLSAIVRLIGQGYGHAFLPFFLVHDELERGELAAIDTEPIDATESIQVFCSESRWISPPMQAFIDFMKEQL